ncbi:magnesium transporter CorA family protein [Deinococcus koreensis]|uniref:Magnesium transporter CorA n=1 Tax=Deinococcus koreensis TaxID=2054903 RepID=A0A2K3UZ04_9DEIO|nr:CorA family divalent cation transporter [Deinococcus koreensis]PNY81768.1 hypothetical protein CVO96_10615 [Deinococcus koreensis]
MPISALLFDAQGQDSEIDLGGGLPALDKHQLLWIDIQGEPGAPVETLLRALPLDERTCSALLSPGGRPSLHRHDSGVHLRISAVEKGLHHYRPVAVQIAVSENIVCTAHEEPVSFLTAFRGRLETDTQLGRLDSAAFLAVLLTEHIEGYVLQLAPLEDNIDRLDERILSEKRRERQHLETLVGLRRRVSELRRLLGAHRPVYVGLASPDFLIFQDDQPEAMLTRLLRQFEQTQEAVGQTRETVLGTFDLLMSSTGQRTNDVMRALTVVTVTLGIIAAVAGVMGMNFQADIFKAGNTGFRDVLLFSAGLSVLVVALGRWRGWL